MLIESSLCTQSHVVQKTITIKLIVHGVVSRRPVERKCPNKMDRGTNSKLTLTVQKKNKKSVRKIPEQINRGRKSQIKSTGAEFFLNQINRGRKIKKINI